MTKSTNGNKRKIRKIILRISIPLLLIALGFFIWIKYGFDIVEPTPQHKQNINEEKKDGETIIYYDNGNIKEQGFYKNGKEIGDWIYYYENGQVMSTRTYIQRDGYENPVIVGANNINYREDGTIESSMETDDNGEIIVRYTYDENGIKNSGITPSGTTYYNEDGTVSGIMGIGLNPSDDNSDDKSVGYTGYFDYEKGLISEQGNLVDGIEEGEWKFYNLDGYLIRKGNYSNGKETGEWDFYYNNGNIFYTGEYKDGAEIGKRTSYYENGDLLGYTNYDNGELEFYHQDGTVMTIEELREYINSMGE